MNKIIAIVSFFPILFSLNVAGDARSRLAVPDYVECDRNALTSWFGLVTEYQRTDEGIRLEMATDFDTQEQLDLKISDQDRLLSRLRIDGRPFKSGDWPLIEDVDGTLRKGVRATIWVCEESEILPIINWQPNSQPSE